MERYIIGSSIKEIETPALLLDLDIVEDNIKVMANYIKSKAAKIRPHFKTHKSIFLAHKQIREGAIGITCQKLSEAEVLAKSGIENILITNEIIGSQKIKRIVNLASYADIIVVVDNIDNANQLSEASLEKGIVVNILIEINIGMNKCGVEPGEEALQLANKIKNLRGIHFKGVLAYEGHAVFIESFRQREIEVLKSLEKVYQTINMLENHDIKCEIVASGGTGTFMITSSYPCVTEIAPGSYLTMDTKYNSIEGVKEQFKNALSLLTTIISKPSSKRMIIDAGMKSISTEFGLPSFKDIPDRVAAVYDISEEHGFIKLIKTKEDDFKIGQKVELIPSHCCTTINLHDNYYGIRSGVVECVLPIDARGKIY